MTERKGEIGPPWGQWPSVTFFQPPRRNAAGPVEILQKNQRFALSRSGKKLQTKHERREREQERESQEDRMAVSHVTSPKMETKH